MITKYLRSGTLFFGKERLGFSHKEKVTHSIRSRFAMKIYPSKLYQETIMIMERWEISAFLRYIRIHISVISRGISTRMKNNNDLYTIT